MFAGMTSRCVGAGVLDRVGRVELPRQQQVVDRGHVVGLHAEPRRERALRVEVDREHAAAVLGERRAEVDGGRRLADAALLVAEGDDAGGAVRASARRLGELAQRATGRDRDPTPARRCRPPGRTRLVGHVVVSSPGRRAVAWSILASTWVGCRVHLPECVGSDERVDLGRRDRGMPEQLLHDAHVGAAREQVGRERVPQGVRRDGCRDAGPLGGIPDDLPRGLPRQPLCRGRRGTARAWRSPARESSGRPRTRYASSARARVAAHRDDPLLAALAEQAHDLLVDEVVDVERRSPPRRARRSRRAVRAARGRAAGDVVADAAAAMSAATSSTGIALGSRVGIFGGRRSRETSVASAPSSARKRCSPRTAESTRAIEEVARRGSRSAPRNRRNAARSCSATLSGRRSRGAASQSA